MKLVVNLNRNFSKERRIFHQPQSGVSVVDCDFVRKARVRFPKVGGKNFDF